MNKVTAGGGIGLGSILAIIISWSVNQSIIWAIIHGFLDGLILFITYCSLDNKKQQT